MNKVFLVGRLTKDPDVRYSQNEKQTAIARFTVAVDRIGQDAGTDFISCVAFGKTAETIEKYMAKGSKIVIDGHIQTGNYEKDGQRIYTTDAIVDRFEFGSYKSDEKPAEAPVNENGFMNIPDAIDEDLPFN